MAPTRRLSTQHATKASHSAAQASRSAAPTAPALDPDAGNVAAAQAAVLNQARKCAAGDMDHFKHSGVIYGYVRVSSVEQSRFSHGHVSLEAQRGTIQAFVEQKGWRGAIRWVEEVVSARSMDKQAQLKKILRDIPANSIVVSYDVSRFSRNTRDGLNYLHSLYKKGCQLWSAAEGVQYYGTVGKNIFTITLAMAEVEGNRISDRVKSALAYCRARGDFLGREAPFGQEAVRLANGRRVLRPNRAEERLIATFQRLWHGFEGGYRAFADHLNELGHSYRGKDWTGYRIQTVLEGNNLRMAAVAAALPVVTRERRVAGPAVQAAPTTNPNRTLRSLRSQARAMLNEAREEMDLDPAVGSEEEDGSDGEPVVAEPRTVESDGSTDSTDSEDEDEPLIPFRQLSRTGNRTGSATGLRHRRASPPPVVVLPRATGGFNGRR